jgi:pimeloyl-ACP methyl ester carboxylesterase
VITDAGHFVWEEEPAKDASAVLDSVTGNRP